MVTKLVTKLVTKEPCSIFSVRLYAPTVSQTVGNTRVTEGFGGDEGGFLPDIFVSTSIYPVKYWYD